MTVTRRRLLKLDGQIIELIDLIRNSGPRLSSVSDTGAKSSVVLNKTLLNVA